MSEPANEFTEPHLHPDVARDILDQLIPRSRLGLRDVVNTLADRKLVELLEQPASGELAMELDRLATAVAGQRIKAMTATGGGPTPPLIFTTVVEFCTEFFFRMYRREVSGTTEIKWCPEWWRHSEAILHLEAIWRTWEFYQRQPATGISVWLQSHAHPLMRSLMNPEGTFKYCAAGPGKGHFYKRTCLKPLPHTPPPPKWFERRYRPST
ncbi:DUF4913 domain-containing protein [Nocardia brasiliensis]|uniref:DUF4913 domain-containing protein n=1 Tax=Nocardia brasiliensis TaxID=37326 RepID=UPI003D8FBE2C